jgi:uroporphyrinogen decarboxylase
MTMKGIRMNKRELVKDALGGRSSGRVPYHIALTGDAVAAYGDRLLDDYRDDRVMEDLALGKIDKGAAVSLAIGNHMHYVGPPWWDWFITDDSFSREDPPPQLPDTRGRGSYEAFFEHLRFLRERYDVYLLVIIFGSHIEKARNARGGSFANILADLVVNTRWAQSLLDLIIGKNLVMLENILTAPEIDGVLLGSDWGSQRDLMMSPETWRATIKDGERREYDLIHRFGKNAFVHSCGNITRIMADLADMGLDCLNPVQPECMDIEYLKREYGGRLAWYGGISTQKTLPYGTPAEVRAETRRVIGILGRGGGLITSPSQEIQTDVPYDNLRALIDTAREFA